MSESKAECSICHRPPGGQHHDTCRKSRRTTRALSGVAKIAKREGTPAGYGKWVDRLFNPPPPPVVEDSISTIVGDHEVGTKIIFDGRECVVARNGRGEKVLIVSVPS